MASPACLHGRRCIHGKGKKLFCTNFPVFSLQLIVLKPIIKERIIIFYSLIHEVVFIKTTNQSWAWQWSPWHYHSPGRKKASSLMANLGTALDSWSCLSWPMLVLALLTKRSSGHLVCKNLEGLQRVIIEGKLEVLLRLHWCPEHFSRSIFIYCLLI